MAGLTPLAPAAAPPDADSGVASPTLSPDAQSLAVTLQPHALAGYAEPDVFVRSAADPSLAERVGSEAAADTERRSLALFASAQAIESDLSGSQEGAASPVPRGAELGLSLGQWLAASGSGSYSADASVAALDLRFEALIPNGVYSLWCGRIEAVPGTPMALEPCGAADGSNNAFVAAPDGTARIALDTAPLAPSSPASRSALVVVFHSDGQTHGATPGERGRNAHVQLFWLLPEGGSG